MVNCVACNKEITEKDILGINKKMLGEKTKSFYCLECLASYLECTVDELLDRIEEFKDEGCILFK